MLVRLFDLLFLVGVELRINRRREVRCSRYGVSSEGEVDGKPISQLSARPSDAHLVSGSGPFSRDSRNDSPLVFGSIRWL
jgi:hypothetical protein